MRRNAGNVPMLKPEAKSAGNPKEFRPGMQINIRGTGRDEHAIAFEELERGVFTEHGAAAVQEQEYFE